MSISHKAYLFATAEFDRQLAPLLYSALARNDPAGLRDYIRANQQDLHDPDEEMPLAEDWETHYHLDVQQYAAFALTNFYDPTDDWGLGHDFDALGAYLESVPKAKKYTGALLGGYLFGPKGKRLDPGYMGTGLATRGQVRALLAVLEKTKWPPVPGPDSPVFAKCYYKPASAADVQDALRRLTDLYRRAAGEGKGLLFADFNDCGVGRM